MVLFVQGIQDIAIFSAGRSRSLVLQLTNWSERHHGFALRLLSSRQADNAAVALGGAVFCVIDATVRSQQILPVLEACVERLGAERVAVYCEASDEALERLVRSFGILFYMGEMGEHEWDWALRLLAPVEAPKAASPRSWHTESGGSPLWDVDAF